MGIKVDTAGAFHDVLDLQVLSGGAFRRVLSGYVNDGAGNWKACYTYNPQVNTTITANASDTSIINAPHTSITISGHVTPASGAVPTGSTVELYNGATKIATTTTDASANYSFTWTPSTTGTYTLTVKYLLNGYYQPSQADTAAINVHAYGYINYTASYPDTVTGANISVPVTVTSDTAEVPGGTVRMWLYTGGAGGTGGTWTVIGSATLSGGSATVVGSYAGLGLFPVYLDYAGSGNFDPTAGGSANIFLMRPTPGAFTVTAGTVNLNNCDFNYSASSNATSYTVYCPTNGLSWYMGTATYFNYYNQHGAYLAADSSYTFYVIANNENTTDGATYGTTAGSIYITANVGHAQVNRTGSFANLTFNSIGTANWRSDGWDSFFTGGDMVQGAYGTSGNYYSVAKFDCAGIRSYIDSHYGAGVTDNMSVTGAQVYLDRTASSGGTSAAVDVGFYVSNTAPNSGSAAPVMRGTQLLVTGLAKGSAGYLTYDNGWAADIARGSYICVGMYNGGNGYSQYAPGTNVKLRFDASWNFVITALKNSTWSYS